MNRCRGHSEAQRTRRSDSLIPSAWQAGLPALAVNVLKKPHAGNLLFTATHGQISQLFGQHGVSSPGIQTVEK